MDNIVPADPSGRLGDARPEESDAAGTLQAVETLLQKGRREIVFPAWLEARFERETRLKQSQRLSRAAISAVIPYNAFIVCDIVLMRDTLGLAIALHLLFVTPAILASAWLLRQNPAKRWRECASAATPIAIVLQVLAVYLCSGSENAPHYLYFVILTTIVANTAMQLSYPSARIATAVNLALLLATQAFTRSPPVSIAFMQCVSFAGCAYASLRSTLDRDRDFRSSYLHRLRDHLRVATTDLEARRDGLTGLANRRRLDEAGAAMWARADAEVSPISAILFDVDRFKAFNDLYGHPAGDSCLRRIAACAEAELRGAEDLAARYGGEEFMLLLPRTTLADALRVAERLRTTIAALGIAHQGAENLGIVTASFGVASAVVSRSTFASLTTAADQALYAAKRGGRNRVSAPPASRRTAAVA